MITYIPPEIDQSAVNYLKSANPPYLITSDNVGLINQLFIPSFILFVYKKYLKRFKFLQILILNTFNFFYQLVLNIRAICFERINLRWRNLISLSNYIEKNQYEKFVIYERTSVTFDSDMDVYPKSKADLVKFCSDKESFFPDVYITDINNAVIIGGSALISAGDYVISHDLLDLKTDLTSEEIHRYIVISKNFSKLRLTTLNNISDLILPAAATFLDACSSNYAHWMSEVLPKIVIFCQDERFKNIPIVVDADLHSNIVDSLLMVVGEARKIYMLSRKVSLKVTNLYVVSVVGYVPFGVRNNSNNQSFHGVFSRSSLLKLQNTFNLLLGDYSTRNPSNCIPPEKIYLKRTGIRKLTNYLIIEKALFEKGYVKVNVSGLSLLQQMCLFSNARYIVAPTGAALANLIFCKPGTVVYVLLGQHNNMIYRYWFNMLAHLGVRVKLVIGEQVSTFEDYIHSDYKIELNDLIYAIEKK